MWLPNIVDWNWKSENCSININIDFKNKLSILHTRKEEDEKVTETTDGKSISRLACVLFLQTNSTRHVVFYAPMHYVAIKVDSTSFFSPLKNFHKNYRKFIKSQNLPTTKVNDWALNLDQLNSRHQILEMVRNIH